MARDRTDVLVIGGGPAGVVAALRAGRLGARTALVTEGELGGMAANDGPVPVRTLAHAARLVREARQLARYGMAGNEVALDYSRLLARVREVTGEVRARSVLRDELAQAGVAIYEHAGNVRFSEPDVIEGEDALRLSARNIIICTGGAPRRLPLPGSELTSTHSDAWRLASAPESMIVIGAGATGVQVASIFDAFGSRVTLFEAGPHVLMSEDEQVAAEMGDALRACGIRVLEDAGTIDRFESCHKGVRVLYSKDGTRHQIEATLVIAAIGWMANTGQLGLANAGVQTDRRGYVEVDGRFRTSVPGIYAAGDVTGHVMVVHEGAREGFLAASDAVTGSTDIRPSQVSPLGSFTDPEYASVGLTEGAARETHDVIAATQRFESLPRAIIDGRETGFCKLIVDRDDRSILGCHLVGERAVELAQLAAVAMASGMTVEQLALVPFSFPTYSNALARAAVTIARELDPHAVWVDDAYGTEVPLQD